MSINATDKLGSFGATTTRVRRPTSSSYMRCQGHDIEEATVERAREAKLYIDYFVRNEFENIKRFERENIFVT